MTGHRAVSKRDGQQEVKAMMMKIRRFFEGNLLVAAALSLPVGMLIAFLRAGYDVPLWPLVFLTPAMVAAMVFLVVDGRIKPRALSALNIGLGAAIGVALSLIERPWLDSFNQRSFGDHALGLIYGGAIAGLWYWSWLFLAWRKEKRGPFTQLIDSAPYLLCFFFPFAGAALGAVSTLFFMIFWTVDFIDMRPAFMSSAVSLTLATSIAMGTLGALLAWIGAEEMGGGDGAYQSVHVGSSSGASDYSSSSSSHDDD